MTSLECALADIEMLQAAYPDEVQEVSRKREEFPLQCQVCLESVSADNEQLHHQQQPQQQQQQQQQHRVLSHVTLEWNDGYPISSGIHVASYRFSASCSKARMDAVLAAIKQESEQCQQDEMEGGLACVAAALRAWNDFENDSNNEHGAAFYNSDNNNSNGVWDPEDGREAPLLQQQLSLQSCTAPAAIPPTYYWVSGTPLTDRKSTFQAHVCRVESEQQVHKALEQLLTSHSKLQRATHNMYAFRLLEESKGRLVLKHDNDDDGEDGAGSRLAQLLQSRNEQNVLVVVSRWYGGIQLGPKRFAHITNVARDVLVMCHQEQPPGWNQTATTTS